MKNPGTARYARAAHTAWRTVDGETIIIDLRANRALCVNETAGRIWEALNGATSLRDLVEEKIVSCYAVKQPAAMQDAVRWLHGLEEEGLVVRCTEKKK